MNNVSFDYHYSFFNVRSSFYVTNDHFYCEGNHLLRTLEEYASLPFGVVVYRNERKMEKIVAKSIAYANGIDISPDGSLVYVASPTTGYVHVLDRRLSNGNLKPKEKVDVVSL
jgi:arylesterase / paraoxonase